MFRTFLSPYIFSFPSEFSALFYINQSIPSGEKSMSVWKTWSNHLQVFSAVEIGPWSTKGKSLSLCNLYLFAKKGNTYKWSQTPHRSMAHKAFCCLCSIQRKWFTTSLDRPCSPINDIARAGVSQNQAAWKRNEGYRFQTLEIILTFSNFQVLNTKACFGVRGQLCIFRTIYFPFVGSVWSRPQAWFHSMSSIPSQCEDIP